MRAKLQSKRVQVSIVIAITALVVLAGTFAWSSFSQQRINEFHITNAPNVNLHDDFAGGPEKDVYVENSGIQPVLVRVRLTELLIQAGALLPSDAIDDEQGSNWHVHSPHDGDCEVCSFPAHEYFTWAMNGQKFYMPASDSAKGKLTDEEYVEPLAVGDLDVILDYTYLLREAFGNDQFLLTYIDEYLSGDTTNTGYLQNAIENLPDSLTVLNVRQYDGQPEDEQTRRLNEVRLTLIPNQIITMQDWRDGITYSGEPFKKGSFWVMDTDGWCYWASPLESGNATGQLLSGVDYVKIHDDDDLIYRINVVLNATTFENSGVLNTFFLTAEANGGITEEGKLLMLMTSGDYVVGADSALYVDDGGGLFRKLNEADGYKPGDIVFAGADGNPGSGDDLTVGAPITIAGTAYTISGFTMGVNGVVISVTGAGEITAYLTPVNESGELDPQGEQYAFVSAGEDGEIGSEDDGVSADPNYEGGFGTEESPFLIATREQLAYMRDTINTKANYSQNKHFKQIADIDLENELWIPIGVTATKVAFKGVYHGDGYKISGLNVLHDNYETQGAYAGFFGRLNGGSIYNLAVEGSVINNVDDGAGNSYTGGIAAIMTTGGGEIRGCVFSGNVKGVNNTGGIVGRIDNDCKLSNNFVAFGSTVDGENKLTGGIVGRVHDKTASVTTSYSLAEVTGTTATNVGGVSGSITSGSTVSNCAFLQTATLNSTLNTIGIGAGTVTNTDPISDLTGDLLTRLNSSGAAWSQNPAGSWPLPAVIRDRSLGAYLGDLNYAGGKGTEAEPYLIATREQLTYMRDRVNTVANYSQGLYFKQIADIDLGGVSWTMIGISTTYAFKGIYDGDGYQIDGLNISASGGVGLFGNISNGMILNVSVEGTVTATGTATATGGIAAWINEGSVISGCVFSGTVNGHGFTGGIVGYSSGSTIENCYVKYGSEIIGDMESNASTIAGYTGGIVGSVTANAPVTSCYSLASITKGKLQTGGIAGNVTSSTVSNCAFIKTEALNAGFNDAIGRLTGSTFDAVGYFSDLNSTLTATNGTTITAASLAKLLDAGAEGSGKDWVQHISGGSWPLPVKIRDKSLGAYSDPKFAGGKGTLSEPYLIANKEQLAYMRDRVNAGTDYVATYFMQTANIDLNNEAWTPIGRFTSGAPDNVTFKGFYDGGGYSITKLLVNEEAQMRGLFGDIDGGGISNLYVQGSIEFSQQQINHVGGIVGRATNAYITDCVFSGSVKGFQYVGGIVGRLNQSNALVKNCYVTLGSTVQSTAMAFDCGGVVGLMYDKAKVQSSYSLASVSGKHTVGGVVGDTSNAGGTVADCAYLKTGMINNAVVNAVGRINAPAITTTDNIGYFDTAQTITLTNSSGEFTGNLLALLNKGGEGQWRAAVGGENDGYPVLAVMK